MEAPKDEQRVVIEIVEIQGTGECSVGHVVGDTWAVDSNIVPEGICGWAYGAMLPSLQVLRFGGSFPWDTAAETQVCCPDPANPVVFRLRVEED